MTLAFLLFAAQIASNTDPTPELNNARRSSLAALDDVDGDRVRDFAVGGVADELVVLSGRDGAELSRFGSWGPRANLVATGDLNGDGVGDLLRASPVSESATLHSGADGSALHVWNAAAHGAEFGHHAACGPDVDGDGRADVIFGTRAAGRAFVYSGTNYALLGWVELDADGIPTWVPLPTLPDPRRATRFAFGTPVALVPDADDDGRADILVGGDALLWVVSTGTSETLLRLDGDAPQSHVHATIPAMDPMKKESLIRALNRGEDDRVRDILREAPPVYEDPRPAWSAGALDDLDGDGRREYFAVALDGWLRFYDGATGSVLAHTSWVGGYMHAEGVSVDATGDFDDDGRVDVLVGANEQGMDSDPGWILFYASARRGFDRRPPWKSADRRFGDSLKSGMDGCVLGDVDNDDVPDFAVNAVQARSVLVVSGRDLEPLWTLSWSEVCSGERGGVPLRTEAKETR